MSSVDIESGGDGQSRRQSENTRGVVALAQSTVLVSKDLEKEGNHVVVRVNTVLVRGLNLPNPSTFVVLLFVTKPNNLPRCHGTVITIPKTPSTGLHVAS